MGVIPTNQASARLSVVPVLPATCQPGTAAPVPVPPVTVLRSWSTVQSAASSSIARMPGCGSWYSTIPWGFTIRSTKYGSWRTPRLASDATTVVISSGVDSIVPSVSVRIGCSVFWRMPSFFAMSMTSVNPTASCIRT